MSDEPERFQIERNIDGIVIRLPQRKLGPNRGLLGWSMTGFGAIGLVFLLVWTVSMFSIGIGILAQRDWFGLGIVLIGMLGLFGITKTQKLLAAGWTILRNRTQCTIEISADRAYSTEHLMWTRFRRKLRLDRISKIVAGPAVSRARGAKRREISNLVGDHQGFLTLVRTDGKPFLLAPAYPLELTRELANIVHQEINRRTDETIPLEFDDGTSPLKDAMLESAGLGEGDDFEPDLPLRQVVKPAHCRVELVERDGTTAFQVPPAGLVKGSHGLFIFAIVWTLFTVGVGSVFLFAIDFDKEGWNALFPLGMILLFVLIGLGMLLAGYNMGTRSIMIGVADGLLFWERKSIFGTKWRDIEVANVERVRVGPSGMSVNNVPVLHLIITTKDGTNYGMLSQLTNPELEWLAWELNEALGLLPSAAPQSDETSASPDQPTDD